ncbi:MAG: AbrB/MazE/SpoVT family DNA-binding domain-containing protein [Candidatus Omnitrophica bacterium]|nr:AbrB/MazE/SpoVT family DNA-binding domain-containing protein [Candidatus Omnitrophota bacterium]
MTILETAKITSKGQVTIPNRIRKMLRLKEGESVGFSITKEGVVLVPCQVTVKSPYTPQEWQKIEKLAAEKGKTFTSAKGAKDYLKSL